MIWLLKNWRKVAIGLAAVAILGIISAGYIHYTGLVNENARIKQEKVILEKDLESQRITIAAQVDAIDMWEAGAERLRLELERQREVEADARAEADRLRRLFGEHDLDALAGARPESIERLVNRGSARLGRLLECASGAVGHPECPGEDAQDTDASQANAN
ncbi:gp02 [Alphaproteobacteria phage PhiJL001]|uniref:Gp02 n=1 Tax=Alphaproteobacteria phage PhiJL001 TaxID=2681607 RepID=Q5DNA3_9CAUD|nr:gp02 [Alphaproteobacteria phage PhiJL001]AAT69460.1 gp02 [Alphaproteobacteria phage PhiJL001]